MTTLLTILLSFVLGLLLVGKAVGECDTTTPTGEDRWTQVREEYCKTDVGQLIRIHGENDVSTMRTLLVLSIWGTGTLPSRDPDTIKERVQNPFPSLANLSSVDLFWIYMAAPAPSLPPLRSVVYHFKPSRDTNRLMIFHQGHDYNPLAGGGGLDTIQYFLNQGYGVLALQMPLFGDNTDPVHFPDSDGADCSLGSCTPHNRLGQWMGNALTTLKYFLEPVAVALNYSMKKYGVTDVSMIGISGGGWTTTVYAAIDPRVRVSIPVAGSLPYYLRAAVCNGKFCDEGFEDWEQKYASGYQYGSEPRWGLVDYTEQYILGSVGKGRRQIQVLNQFDNLDNWKLRQKGFAYGVRYKTYEKTVASIAEKLGGRFEVLLDSSHGGHKISKAALNTLGMLLTDQIPNIAQAKRATQSSTFKPDPGVPLANPSAESAVDGDTNGDWHAGSVTATEKEDEDKPWWEVDLGSEQAVDKVEIWNRTDCCPWRLQNFDVLLLDSNRNEVFRHHECGQASTPTMISIPENEEKKARYVKVQLRGRGILSLAEVRVWPRK